VEKRHSIGVKTFTVSGILKKENNMDAIELLSIISSGETSKVQFKEEMPHRDSISQEIVAMSNSRGGVILLGIQDITGDPIGLSAENIERYDNQISQIADNTKPIVYITTEVVTISKETSNANILIVYVSEGINKPYKTPRGEIYVKQGSNKRLLTDNAEIMRLFQSSGNLLADEMEVYGTSINDIDNKAFLDYFKKEFGQSIEEKGLSYEQALKAKRVLRNDRISLAGLLFFGKAPQTIKPAFTIKVVSFFGNDISGTEFKSKPSDLQGTIPQLFNNCVSFLKSNLHFLQEDAKFNTKGRLEISEIAITELLQNALVHRDYYKNSPIRVLVFNNRVEIISPGKLPNSLTVEDIKYGNPIIRNNQIVSFSSHTMPFSGLGSGIRRSLREQKDIELINDIDGEQFKVIIPRPNI
jgi:ATP-dependent DNA helicase RecG